MATPTDPDRLPLEPRTPHGARLLIGVGVALLLFARRLTVALAGSAPTYVAT